MKFLLKQHIRKGYHGIDSVRIYPGVPDLIKLANKLEINYTKKESKQGNYLVTDYYIFNKEDYSTLLSQYRQNIFEKREKFKAQDPLIQLIKLLRYIFERNNKAKTVEKYYAKLNAYDDKSLFLEKALNIAKEITYSFFIYGYEEDQYNNYHHYIYYFEVQELGQVSFHDSCLYSNVPIFSGEWIGFHNEKFPFNLRDVKKLIKENNNQTKQEKELKIIT